MDTITTFTAPPITNNAPKCTSSPTPPTGANANDLWFDTKTGFLFIWYFDGNTYQWVVSNPGRGGDVPPPSSVSPVEILANPGIVLVPNPIKGSGTVGVDTTWLAAQLPTTLPPNGAAAGDLAGTYPSPTIKNSVALTGAPTVVTVVPTGNANQTIATTAFVKAQGYLSTAAANGLYQPLDAGLTALANLDATAGLVEETGLDTFVKRAIGVSTGASIPTTALADARYATITHTHTSSQITDFAEATDDRVAALLQPGTNISLTYNDISNTLTVAAAAYPASLPPSGPAGGDLTGTYPNPTFAWISHVGGKTLTISNTLTFSGVDGSTLNIGAGGTLGSAAFTASTAYLAATAVAGGALTGNYPNPQLVGGPLSNYAPLASPVFTGNPTAPTPTAGDNDTSIATTAFVAASFAPLASPALTGNPTAPTPTAGDNDTSIATTAFVSTAVAAAVGGSTPTGPAGGGLAGTYPNPLIKPSVTNGDVLQTTGGIAVWGATPASPPNGAAGGDLAGTYPNPTLKASVGLTGTPTSTTPLTTDNTTSIATTAFVKAQGYLTSTTAGALYQPLDADLTALAGLSATAGLVEQTGAAAFTKRLLGVANSTDVLTRADGDGRYLTPATAASTYLPLAGGTLTGKETTVASAAGAAGFNLPHGAAPTAPVNGDLWTTTAGILARINGATVGPLISAASIPAALPPNGGAAGDLAGSYPSPTIKASVALTGTPTAPTVATADNTTSIATSAFVKAQGYATTTYVDNADALKAPLASPVFTGNPTAPTPTAGDNDTSVATTAFVTGAVATAISPLASLASPTFTGDPKAPTPATSDNDTSIATTAMVQAAITAGIAAARQVGNFYATLTSGPTIPAVAATVLFNTVLTGNSGTWYATGTGRFTPPAGRYYIYAAVCANNPSSADALTVSLRKNGTVVIAAATVGGANFPHQTSVDGNFDANGTDFFDIQASANATAVVAPSQAWFGAFPI